MWSIIHKHDLRLQTALKSHFKRDAAFYCKHYSLKGA